MGRVIGLAMIASGIGNVGLGSNSIGAIEGRSGMSDRLIKLEVADGVAVLTNDRPQKHNAANDEMDRQLFDASGARITGLLR